MRLDNIINELHTTAYLINNDYISKEAAVSRIVSIANNVITIRDELFNESIRHYNHTKELCLTDYDFTGVPDLKEIKGDRE